MSENRPSVTFPVAASQSGMRLDVALTAVAGSAELESGPSRSQVEKWIEDGCVSVDGKTVRRGGLKLKAGMVIHAAIPETPPAHLVADPSVHFSIVHEDSDLLVIDKPAGVVVHPGAGIRDGTLVQGLVSYLGEQLRPIGDALRPGIVHRLDKDTSGLMVVAKHEESYRALVRQFAPPRSITRVYLALTCALPNGAVADGDQARGTINLPIGRDPRMRVKMAVTKDRGRESQTEWSQERRFAFGHLLQIRLNTGRTHQIRVHMQASCAPIIGDALYGPPERSYPPTIKRAVRDLGRQALHASRLMFVHPRFHEPVSFCSELPADISRLIRELESYGAEGGSK